MLWTSVFLHISLDKSFPGKVKSESAWRDLQRSASFNLEAHLKSNLVVTHAIAKICGKLRFLLKVQHLGTSFRYNFTSIGNNLHVITYIRLRGPSPAGTSSRSLESRCTSAARCNPLVPHDPSAEWSICWTSFSPRADLYRFVSFLFRRLHVCHWLKTMFEHSGEKLHVYSDFTKIMICQGMWILEIP